MTESDVISNSYALEDLAVEGTGKLYDILLGINEKLDKRNMSFFSSAKNDIFRLSEIDDAIGLLSEIEDSAETIEMIRDSRIAQVFCDRSLNDILSLLDKELRRAETERDSSEFVSANQSAIDSGSPEEATAQVTDKSIDKYTFLALTIGQRIQGKILRIDEKYASIDFGWREDGLLRISELNNSSYGVGDTIIADVESYDQENNQVFLSRKKIQNDIKALQFILEDHGRILLPPTFQEGAITTGIVVSIAGDVQVYLGNDSYGSFKYTDVSKIQHSGKLRIGSVSLRTRQKVQVRIINLLAKNKYELELLAILDMIENENALIALNALTAKPTELKIKNKNKNTNIPSLEKIQVEAMRVGNECGVRTIYATISGDEYAFFPFEGKLNQYAAKEDVSAKEIPIKINGKAKILTVYLESNKKILYIPMTVFAAYGEDLFQVAQEFTQAQEDNTNTIACAKSVSNTSDENNLYDGNPESKKGNFQCIIHIPSGISGIKEGDYVLYPFDGKLNKYIDKNNVISRQIPLEVDGKVKILTVYVETTGTNIYIPLQIYKLFEGELRKANLIKDNFAHETNSYEHKASQLIGDNELLNQSSVDLSNSTHSFDTEPELFEDGNPLYRYLWIEHAKAAKKMATVMKNTISLEYIGATIFSIGEYGRTEFFFDSIEQLFLTRLKNNKAIMVFIDELTMNNEFAFHEVLTDILDQYKDLRVYIIYWGLSKREIQLFIGNSDKIIEMNYYNNTETNFKIIRQKIQRDLLGEDLLIDDDLRSKASTILSGKLSYRVRIWGYDEPFKMILIEGPVKSYTSEHVASKWLAIPDTKGGKQKLLPVFVSETNQKIYISQSAFVANMENMLFLKGQVLFEKSLF